MEFSFSKIIPVVSGKAETRTQAQGLGSESFRFLTGSTACWLYDLEVTQS